MKKPFIIILSLILIWSVSYAQNIKGVVSKSITTQAPPPANAPVIQLNINSNQSSVTIPDNFQGFSYETEFITESFLNTKNTILIQLVKNLGKGILRVGGYYSDVWIWTGKPRSTNTIGDSLTTTDVDNFSAFAKSIGWPVIFGLNLGNYSTTIATNEALYVNNSLQNNLYALQFGNEPDEFHGNAKFRSSTYSYQNYQTEWESYFTSISKVLSNPPLAGPDICCITAWYSSFAQNEHQNIKLLTGHYYVAGYGPSTTCGTILAHQSGLISALKTYQTLSSQYNIPFRVSECGTFPNVGYQTGVADVFASTLWALDFMWTVASYGVQGVNFHGANRGGLSPVVTVNGITTPRPEYYGMLAFKYGTTIKNIVPVTINNPQNYNCSAYACSNGQQTNITIINKDTVNNLSYNITLFNNAQNIQVLRLQAPTIHSKSGVQFAGDSVHADGTFKPGTIENYVVQNSTFNVNVPAASAALVIVNPSNDATLSNLVPSAGTLSPTFIATTTSYAETVSNNISSITLTPTVADTNATVTVNGTMVSSGTVSNSLPLVVGNNTISIVVTAQDGTIKTYTLVVTRPLKMQTITFDPLTTVLSLEANFAPGATVTSNLPITYTSSNPAVANITRDGKIHIVGAGSTDITASQPGDSINYAAAASVTQTLTVLFALPAIIFNLTISSETCIGSGNGTVVITAVANNNYTAVLTGNGVNTTQQFTGTTTFSNLSAGTYTLTFTVDGQANYSNTYTVNITQPQPLSVYAAVNNALGTINLALSGGEVYHIQVNNKTYTTTQSSFSVPLEQGNNALQVTTDRECQGIFSKLINPSLNITPYPIPFESTLNLNLGSDNVEKVSVRIHSASTGMLVYTADFQNQSGVLQLDLSKLSKGAYGLQLIINNTKKEFKIIK